MLPDGEGRSILEDDVRYALPLGLLGRLGGGLARERIESLFAYRHALTAADLARHAELPGPPLRVGITGSHGLIGNALTHFLTTGGHTVTRLGRGEQAGEVDGLDAVVNLAGTNVGDGRWTEARKREIRQSRVRTTEAVVAGILRAARRPAVLINGSAMGYYGDRGDAPVDESAAARHRLPRRGGGGLGGGHPPRGGRRGPGGEAPDRRGAQPRRGGAGQDAPHLQGRRRAVSWARASRCSAGSPSRTSSEPSTSPCARRRCGARPTSPPPSRSPTPPSPTCWGGCSTVPPWPPSPRRSSAPCFGEMGEESVLAGASVVPRALLDAGFRFRWPGLEDALRFCLGKVRLPSAV